MIANGIRTGDLVRPAPHADCSWSVGLIMEVDNLACMVLVNRPGVVSVWMFCSSLEVINESR